MTNKSIALFNIQFWWQYEKAGSLPYYKISSRWIKDKIMKTEIIKVQKENVSEYIRIFGVEKDIIY